MIQQTGNTGLPADGWSSGEPGLVGSHSWKIRRQPGGCMGGVLARDPPPTSWVFKLSPLWKRTHLGKGVHDVSVWIPEFPGANHPGGEKGQNSAPEATEDGCLKDENREGEEFETFPRCAVSGKLFPTVW